MTPDDQFVAFAGRRVLMNCYCLYFSMVKCSTEFRIWFSERVVATRDENRRTFAQNKPDAERTTSHILRFINIRNRNGRAIKLCSFFIGAFRS